MRAICSEPGCDRFVAGRGLCDKHYRQAKTAGNLPPTRSDIHRARGVIQCSIEGCEKPVKARGWCDVHWYRWQANGDPLVARRYVKGGGSRIMVSGYIQVWRPDHPLATGHGYVQEHRMVAWDAGILTDPADHVHHKNHVKDDNRLENLEVKDPSTHHRDHIAEAGCVTNQFGVWPLRRDR